MHDESWLMTDGQLERPVVIEPRTVFDRSIPVTFHLHESAQNQFCQFPLTVTAVAQDLGTVYNLAGSASQVTCPLLALTRNLYWNEVPAARVTVPLQFGF